MKAIVVGASSGIGRAVALELSRRGFALGLMARRKALLEALCEQLPEGTHVQETDVRESGQAMDDLAALIERMGPVDVIVLAAGVGDINRPLEWRVEREGLLTNVLGFAALANVAIHHFEARRQGHLVGISSIAALRGGGSAPAYNASKAFISNYLQGLRQRVTQRKLPITVTEIQPGYVDTAMVKGDAVFWMATPEVAARQIVDAIVRRKPHAYVTRRWRLFAWLLKLTPDFIYRRM
ncbi:SDR family NAD(P)-dependent oxidoreductase [Tahibacter amnicola]|uniref:SDR family NAD(P)-dependent oxidoreductase n=1 Tax=Tahibacter amnicola TaxID=2976241 RepID=A0ABY6BKC0_9GAMM|nr:SDR family NAD(P)-dependent oxidoreductase [Tahibacter amnicola]UXI70217.1 SDR family NAD(P)-dependent oxidoreductase [Tahibacter amnicola]